MTNNEILKADLLDILFEHRNKSYGAYELRRYYNNRLLIALAISIFGVLLFYLISLMTDNNKSSVGLTGNKNDSVMFTDVILRPPPKEPGPPVPPQRPRVAQRDNRTFRIVADKDHVKPLATQEELGTAAISDVDADGEPPADPALAVSGTGHLFGKPSEGEETTPQSTFNAKEYPPTFPGGLQALALFFSRNLRSPEELEAGEKKIVIVRFSIGADGSISKAEIERSAGDVYDREVLRVFKKMPRWNPAIQNGHNVSVSFTQPVTFLGAE